MDFELNEEQKLIQNSVRDFVKKEIAPIADEIDKKDEFPSEIVQKMAGLGILSIPLPEEFGGMGGDILSYVLALEEISKVSVAVAITVAVHTSLVSAPINEFGNRNQKEKYLVPLAKGEKLGAFLPDRT